MVQDYLSGHTAKLAGGSGYKSLLVLDGAAAAYLHVSEIKVRGASTHTLPVFGTGGLYNPDHPCLMLW